MVCVVNVQASRESNLLDLVDSPSDPDPDPDPDARPRPRPPNVLPTTATRPGGRYPRHMPDTPARAGAPAIDHKPRSRTVTDGIEATTSRGMLRAVGMGDADWDKAQVGIASSWNEITPCNLSLDRLARAAKEGVHAGGGYPLQFGTVSVSDGISMGHEGMHFSLVSREVIADSVEVVMQAERLDGSVLLAGCDKSIPGMLMAAARLDLASVFLYAGSIAPGLGAPQRRHRERHHDHRLLRGGRRRAGRHDEPRGCPPHRVRVRPGHGCVRRHVHREHDGVGRRGSRAVAPGKREPGSIRRTPRHVRPPLGRGRREPAEQGHHGSADSHEGSLRERDRRRHGARRLDQHRAAPSRDRARGRSGAESRRLQPHRSEGSAHRRPQAVRQVRHERRRPPRRGARADEGAAGCRHPAR